MLPLKLQVLKQLDGWAGRWLCHHAAPRAAALMNHHPQSGQPAWATRPIPAGSVERILIIRPGGIGDAVLLFPLIRVLREYFPGAAIDVLGERRNIGVYRINDWVRAVYAYDRRPWQTTRTLAQQRYQLIIDTEQYHHLSVVMANHLRPQYLCGFDTLGRGRFQTHRVRYTEQRYEVFSFLDLAAALTGRTIEFDAEASFLEVQERWVSWAHERLRQRGERPLAVIVPSASSHHRFWKTQRYADVAHWLVTRGFFVVILGGQDAAAAAREIAAGARPEEILNLVGRTTLAQTAGVVKEARLYVSADTGVLHIAYGVGTPTVHMFGSGIQEKWAPRGRRYVVVNKGLPCSPCTRYGYTPPCPYGVACMDAIQVPDVTAAIEEVLQR